jgi:oligopeptide transport system permease protein
MLRFALGRLLQAIPVLLIVISATFLLVHSAPGGPFSADKAVPPEVIRALEAQYNLDQPLWQQYLSYLGDVLQGDLGPSFKYSGRTVNELIAAGLPATAELALVPEYWQLFGLILCKIICPCQRRCWASVCPLSSLARYWC